MPCSVYVVIKCISFLQHFTHPHEFIQITSWWCYNILSFIWWSISSSFIFYVYGFHTNIVSMHVSQLLGLWQIHNRMGYNIRNQQSYCSISHVFISMDYSSWKYMLSIQGCTISTCYNFHVIGYRHCLGKFSSPTDTYLYDKSLKDGLLSDSWKEATVVAIHKKGF